MGQPTPPGDIPLYEGLSPEWNDILGALPEDKRAEFGSTIASRTKVSEDYTRWDDLNKSGITPEQASHALNVNSIIENRPQEVYDILAKHLGITPAQAKEVVEEVEETDDDDPRYKQMKTQLDTMSQILLAQNEASTKAQREAEGDAAIKKELDAVKVKFGDDVNDDQILMRMYTKGLSAEEAHKEYMDEVSTILKRRPSPMVLSGGGIVPNKPLDPTKLSGSETKNVVADMLRHARQQGN